MDIKNRISSMFQLRPMLIILTLGFSILGIFSLIKFGTLFTIFMVFPWLVNKLSSITSLNIWLCWLIAVPFTVFFALIIAYVFSFDRQKRTVGVIASGVVVMIFALGMFFLEEDYLFSSDGKPSKCWAETPYGPEVVSCSDSVHRKYGTKVLPITVEKAVYFATQKNGIPEIKRINPTEDISFFGADGTPLAWYYQNTDGQIEMFSRPGYHPKYGKNVVLSPVSFEIVQQLERYMKEGNRNKIVIGNNNDSINFIDKNSPLVKLRNTLNNLYD